MKQRTVWPRTACSWNRYFSVISCHHYIMQSHSEESRDQKNDYSFGLMYCELFVCRICNLKFIVKNLSKTIWPNVRPSMTIVGGYKDKPVFDSPVSCPTS